MAKTARSVKDIAPERLALLNAGTIESATLVECLAVDFAVLLGNVFPKLDTEPMRQAAPLGITKRMALAAELIIHEYGLEVMAKLAHHPSDTVRGWACFMLGAADLALPARLDAVKPYADDAHFGVREWAWLAVRPHLMADLQGAIAQLTPWTAALSERIRRFAVEALRPRGVWCAHIRALKARPEQTLPLLEPLRNDPSKYVQDSVANWLNDAGKDRPEWVQALCRRWQAESPTLATARICKRATRSL